MNDDLKSALEPLVSALTQLNVPDRVVGSVASSVHGMLRATLDVDLVVQLERTHIPGLVSRLRGTYYLDPEGIEEALTRVASFNLIHLETMLKLDLFPLSSREYDQVSFDRVSTLELAERFRVDFKTPEDVILGKLEWYEAGDRRSERQWGDVVNLLRIQGQNLDLEHLRHWAGEIGVTDLLERARSEAER